MHLNLLLPCLLPITHLLLSLLIFHFTLHKSQQHRLILLPFFLCFAILSFTTSKHFSILSPALTSLWSQAVLLNIVHITSLLHIEKWPCPPPEKGRWRNLRTTWRLWGNPQLLHTKPKSPSAKENKEKNTSDLKKPLTKPIFIFLRLAKLPLYYYAHTLLLPLIYSETIIDLDSSDLPPTHTSLLFPFPSETEELTSRDILIRSYFAISWIWESLVYLDTANALLSLFFVGTGLDTPSDWPPLFGNLNQGCGLRNFWGGFWHRIGRRAYGNYGRLLVRKLGWGYGEKQSGLQGGVEKVAIAFFIFLLSGVSHAAISWRIGASFPSQSFLDVRWFMLNFCACTFETLVLSIVRGLADRLGFRKKLREIEESWLGYVVGYGWVFGFFWWSVLGWKGEALRRELMVRERWVEILGKMSVVS